MSIYYFRHETLTRSKKQNAVKYTAYILRQHMHDQQTKKQHNYSHRYGNIRADEWGIIGWNDTPESLANHMESTDNSKNSRVARIFVGALPQELSPHQQLLLTQKIAQDLYDIDQAPLIYVIHHHTENNPHFHIIKSTRQSKDNVRLHQKSRIWEDIKTGPEICKKNKKYLRRQHK